MPNDDPDSPTIHIPDGVTSREDPPEEMVYDFDPGFKADTVLPGDAPPTVILLDIEDTWTKPQTNGEIFVKLDLPEERLTEPPNEAAEQPKEPLTALESDEDLPDAKVDPKEDDENAIILSIEKYMADRSIFVGADGDLHCRYRTATCLADLAELGASEAPTFADIVDGVHHHDHFLMSELKVVMRIVRRVHTKARKAELIQSITKKLSPAECEAARLSMLRLVSRVFDNDPETACRVMLHTIYQVKRKFARLRVKDPLMAILKSPRQGSGKSYTINRLLAPLAEMAKSVRLADLADPRSIFVFRHAMLVVDDMDSIERKAVATLKNRMTDDNVRGRGMQSNHDLGTEQRATFIGTSNESVMDTVPDPTGHRRFYELSFRNGNPADGGDPEVWKAVNETDFLSIWQSVDPFADSPIEAVRDRVFGTTGPRPPKSKVHEWALALDVQSEAFRSVQQAPGVQAQLLFDLYAEQCQDAWMSVKQFGILMREATKDENVPLDWPKRRSNAMYFPLKRLR